MTHKELGKSRETQIMSVMPLKDEMIHILSSSNTRAIRFTFQSSQNVRVSVDSSTFQRIVDGLRSNRFVITSDGVPDGRAAYNPNASVTNEFGIVVPAPEMSGIFRVKRGAIRADFESLVVHESVHASFDMTRTLLPWVDNEVAAHIAQGYYYVKSNIRFYSMTFQPVRIATQLAQYVYDSGFMDNQLLQELRESLLRAGPYQHYIRGSSRGNG